MVPSKILVPVDGSPASLRAVDFAIEMANQNPGTSLVLLNVQNIGATELSGAVMGSYDWQEKASQASGQGSQGGDRKIRSGRRSLKTLVRSGQAAEAIAQVACEEDIQHIVMGTRGLGRIQGLLLGSVAMKVIHLAQIPITLIK